VKKAVIVRYLRVICTKTQDENEVFLYSIN